MGNHYCKRCGINKTYYSNEEHASRNSCRGILLSKEEKEIVHSIEKTQGNVHHYWERIFWCPFHRLK